MKIGVPKETAEGERRVALVPDVVKSLAANEKVEVLVESGAGEAAGHPDSQYAEAGATWDARRVRGRLRDHGVRRRLVQRERAEPGWEAMTGRNTTLPVVPMRSMARCLLRTPGRSTTIVSPSRRTSGSATPRLSMRER